MMLFKVISAAALVAVTGLSSAWAQTAGDFSGPAEAPPASFKGQQFVDSRGCVYLRAGYGGRISWVPRVTGSRKPLCGYPATFAVQAPTTVSPTPSAPAPKGRMPLETVAVTTAPPTIRETPQMRAVDPARYAAPRPVNLPPAAGVAPAARGMVVVPATTRGPRKIGCFTSVPVPQIVRLADGGTAVICTRGDGTTVGWRSPIYPAGTPPGAAIGRPGPNGTIVAATRGNEAAPGTVPQGYVAAWKDDRLNPLRGQGTVAGQAAQDEIWTRDVPARLIAGTGAKRGNSGAWSGAGASVSTKTGPGQIRAGQQPRQAVAGLYVQVGSFGLPDNAEGAAARLADAGLQVQMGGIVRAGKALQTVYAGPFASTGEAKAALGAVRRAGFDDAFIR